jgi:penicillin-binding protein 2
MFERRLKLFLAFLCFVTLVLVVRALQVQVVQRDRWRKAAAETMKRSQLIETVRGRILDRHGNVIARDEAGVDACVDYRALTDPPDESWVNDRAVERLRARAGEEYTKAPKSRRRAMVEEEAKAVRADIDRMWPRLAAVAHVPVEEIQEARQTIIQRVEMRRRLAWYRSYKKAAERDQAEPESFWQKWLIDGGKTERSLDNFSILVAEQTEPHVVVHTIDAEAQIDLGKHIERYPGLVLRPSTHRTYPFAEVACHLMGRVSHVNHEDLDADPEKTDELRQYLPNDEIGRAGLESLCERALRGTKGKIERVLGEQGIVGRTEPVPGRDVRITIDMELQAQVEDAFAHAELIDAKGNVEQALLHGAAVVIDVPTGEVLAMASYPTYDANAFDEHYAEWNGDQINQPLLNRATMAQLQPGSTVKPMVGLSAITQGLIGVNDGIECTGFLVLGGKMQPVGRCWVASKFFQTLQGNVAHHPVPWDAPHPTGFLTYSDALERSCNVYFETIADRLGLEGLSYWMDKWGLGRQTGVGIPEARGRLPRDYHPVASWDRKYKTWFSGIGQDPVAATPIQMANVAATIARHGIWMRPRLVSDAVAREDGIVLPRPTTRPGEPPATEFADRVDLHLSPEGLAAAKDGMFRVVNSRAGTGTQILFRAPKLAGIAICGKTGTAQAGRFAIKVIDEKTGLPVKDERGKPKLVYIDPSTKDHPNPLAPWYRGGGEDGKDLNHAWYIGFAPAENPRVAFAVMVEYGGSGGYAAGGVARKTLEACVDHGYLRGSGGVAE